MRASSLVLVGLGIALGCGKTPARSMKPDAAAAGAPGAAGTTGEAGATSGAGTTGEAGATSEAGVTGAGGSTGDAGATSDAAMGSDAEAVDAAGDAASHASGCGKPLPADYPVTVPGRSTGYKHYTVMGTGATLAGPAPEKAGPRTFWVRVPADYDPSHRYRVVYLGQPCGGVGVANTSTYPLYNEQLGGTEQAIYVAVDIPANMASLPCYDTSSGPSSQEWEAFELFQTFVDQTYCVDHDQIFASGFNTGGRLANMWGCYFAGDGAHPENLGPPDAGAGMTPRRFAPRYHIRGQAAFSAGDPPNNPPCNGPVAALWINTPFLSDAAKTSFDTALTRVLALDGCDSATRPTAPWHVNLPGFPSCVRFTDCPANLPVVRCSLPSSQTDQRNVVIPAFKTFFDEASAPP
jgi:hypothetical protein